MQVENKKKKQILLFTLAKVVKEMRQNIGKSISLISDEINVSKSIWSDVEIGKTDIQLSTFCRIAEALEVTPENLFKELRKNLPDNFSFMD